MACDMTKLVNFSVEKQQLIATCVDSYTGDLCNFVAENVDTSDKNIDKTIRERFQKDVLHGEALGFRTYRKYKNEIFEILETTLEQTLPEGWSENEFFNRFVEVKRVDLGDKNEFYAEDTAMLTVSRFSGNHWDTIRERLDLGTEYSVDTSWYVVHFYNDFERFMLGIDSFTKMLDKARKSFLQQFQNAIYTAFAGMADYAPAEFYGHGTLATTTEYDQLLALVERVETATGVKPVLAGTGAALRKLQKSVDDAWIADSAKEEGKNNGIVSKWEGYDLMAVPQVFQAGTFNFALDNTQILILAGTARPIKFVYEGDARMNETTDNRNNQDQTLEAQIQVKAGCAVVANEIFGTWMLA